MVASNIAPRKIGVHEGDPGEIDPAEVHRASNAVERLPHWCHLGLGWKG